jgi:catechol-2,3-dioxygenase
LALLGFNHYNIRAPRNLMEQLKTFYCDVVGLELGERPALRSFGYWLYAGGTDVLHLSEVVADETPRLTEALTTFDHVAFTCTDYAGTQAKLIQQGIQFTTRELTATNTKQIFFRDPAGNGVEFNFSASKV